MDGRSVVVVTSEETMIRARGMAEKAPAGLLLPEQLTEIGEEAFAGILAEKVEVTAHVVAIGPRAFADCPNLREIHIPASVLSIDETALEGCKNVTVYGEKGSAAEKLADPDAGITFQDVNAEQPPNNPPDEKPIKLPFVPAH